MENVLYGVGMVASESPGVSAPIFRRAERADAIAMAREDFLAGRRVDLQDLAQRLGVARGTLYRWVGGREPLIAEALAEIARTVIAEIDTASTETGRERLIAMARRQLEIFAGFPAIRTFVEREPQLAIRLLMAEGGVVHRELARGVISVMEAGGVDVDAAVLDLVDVLVQVSTSLLWVSFAIGEEPRIDRSMLVLQTMVPLELFPPRG